MRQVLAAVVLLTAGLAGCIGSEDAPVQAANATDTPSQTAPNASIPTFPNGTAAPTTLERLNCDEEFAVFPVPASAYRDRLPEGFSLVPYQGDPTGQTASLEIFAQRCKLPDGTTTARAGAGLLVDPPDAWENPDAMLGHGLVLSMVTTTETVADVNEAWGFGSVARAGEVSIDFTSTPAARTGTVEATADQVSLELSTAVAGQEAPSTTRRDRPDVAWTSQDEASVILRLFALGENGTVTGAKDRTSSRPAAILSAGAGSGQGSAAAGVPERPPVLQGTGGHVLGWDATDIYVDLPPRETS